MQEPDCHRRDLTRQRLIQAATDVFAEHGYAGATTRDICTRAKANAAAVNYHFGDKLGLYTAVLHTFITAHAKGDEYAAMSKNMAPDLALRQFIESIFLKSGVVDTATQYTRLMVHELAQPTTGLELVVKRFIQPRSDALRAIVAKIIKEPLESNRTRLCALSVIGQIQHYYHARPAIMLLWPKWRLNDSMRREMIDHFTRFSLAGLHHFRDYLVGDPRPDQRRRRRS